MKKFLLIYSLNYSNRIVEAEDLYDAVQYNWSDGLIGALYLGEQFDEVKFETYD